MAAAFHPLQAQSGGEKKHWYEKLSLRGYAQLRYNQLLYNNPDLKCEQCDKGWGEKTGFNFRRARIIMSGMVHPRAFVYVQFDLSNTVSNINHFLQVRDLYMDISLDSIGAFRIRAGQSKVPWGFINMQSSSNRLPFDRDDAMNSGAPNERDIGVFFYWAPDPIRKRFAMLVKDGLKGSGDYGAFALGIYNGQTTNRPELNNAPHIVTRLTWPFKIGSKQIFEPGIQYYTGTYTIPSSQLSEGTGSAGDYKDTRIGGTLVLYPQPFGFQAEAMMGTEPRFDASQDSIIQDDCIGGYAMIMYRRQMGKMWFTPFVRSQYYDGGKKQELDARSYTILEHEFGVEWEPIPAVELTASFVLSDRKTSDFAKPDNHQQGHLLRLQLQFNY